MPHFLKSAFLWQFAGGFLIGSAGLLALQSPPESVPVYEPTPIRSVI